MRFKINCRILLLRDHSWPTHPIEASLLKLTIEEDKPAMSTTGTGFAATGPDRSADL
jgi:hypothetical protein